MKKVYQPIEYYVDIFDPNILWYYIPGFSGYEVSNTGLIRSMKHFRRYPYGILIQPVKRKPYGNSTDPLFEISDDNNKRQRIRLSQLIYLAQTNKFAVYGYPRATIVTNTESRNKFVKNDEGMYVKVYNGPKRVRKQLNMPLMDNTAHYAKFTIIQDGTEMPNMEYKQCEYQVPIQPIKKDDTRYFGRSDCKVEYRSSEPFEEYVDDYYILRNEGKING